jgi:two-component system, LytTR family, sensor kinase
VHISLSVSENRLRFIAKNSIISDQDIQSPEVVGADEKNGGIGLENTSKRLSLLYPDRHKLLIQSSENMFLVDLTIYF